MRKFFKTYNKALTPSGLWDNGLYEIKGDVSIPEEHLKTAIIQTVQIKTIDKKTTAYKIFINNNSWIISENPNYSS